MILCYDCVLLALSFSERIHLEICVNYVWYEPEHHDLKAGGLWRHEFAIFGYKLTIHFHIWLFCDVTDAYYLCADISMCTAPCGPHK